ncbi:nucleoside kinase [Liberiplasma polymorphum]|uniref:nucleoside kinase n=1 Tax=Liberiplasma polymorphum TaxID=3374570 RepID=UPI003771D06F
MFRLKFNNEEKTFEDKVKLLDLIDDPNRQYFLALVNNRLRELTYEIDYNATIEFLDTKNYEAIFTYEAGIRFLLAMAFYNLYPDFKFKLNYSVSRTTFCRVLNVDDTKSVRDIVENLKAEMNRLIELDLPIKRLEVSKAKALEFYQKHDYTDKIDILEYRPEETVHFYTCDGYQNYMYNLMVPSTGYIQKFDLKVYPPGFLIQYPRAEADGEIPPFEDAPIYGRTLRDANRWAELIDANTIHKMNEQASKKSMVEFVHMCESKHNQMIAEIGKKVLDDIDNIRLIAIAGPSSSGKTTFSTRLRIELMSLGLKPVMISLDDYYLDREHIQPDEDGNIDLEHINTLDIDLFNRNMLDLIDGKEVEIPHFDFMTKKRSGYKKLRVTDKNPIIIEGIHALNETLTSLIPKHQKYKVFISPQLQINIDHHNPISITNLRLLRRIVRDKKFRNSPASKTISMWQSVRNGEFKWIYPHQEGADYIFNSGLAYELNVMKKYALDTLIEIPRESEHFITANRLIKFLKYFVDIDDYVVPCSSLLREFIGGSCFEV